MKLYITSNLIPLDIKNIMNKQGIEVIIAKHTPSKREIIENIKDVDAIICLLKDKIDKEIIDSASKLKIIANYAVGYDNIDFDYAKNKGIFVTNTPDVLTETTADLAFSLLVSCARRIVESDVYTRKGNFHGWQPNEMLGYDIYGKTIGIFGFGRIGQAIGKRATGFNMKIIYNKRNPVNINYEAEFVSFETLINKSDFISINAPLNNETKYKFTYNEFKKMKNNAIIINTARGKIIKESDLARALKENIIAYAGLDVYENEPEINSDLLKMKNVILTPHSGSATIATRRKMAEICVQSIIEVLINKEKPLLCVNC